MKNTMAEPRGAEETVERVEVSLPSLPMVTEHERDLARQAQHEFERGQYDSCLNMLNKLAATRSNDPRVAHNKAVAEYYQSGFKKTDEFRQNMAGVCQMSQVSIDNVAGLDDVDQCVIYYNQAVILYHLRQYKAAINIMDRVFQFIEPMEENLSRHAMFLLVELYLKTSQPEKAMGMIGFLEKQLFGNGNRSHQQTPEKDGKDGKESGNHEAPNEIWKPKISQMKARCYIMMKSMKSCKREVKGLMNAAGMSYFQSAPIVYIKSNFEYLRGNYRKAMKVMHSVPHVRPAAETGECLDVMFNSNLGVIHFHMKKHHLATFYTRRAMTDNDNVSKEMHRVEHSKSLSGRPVQTLGISQHYELLYNMGIQMLHCAKPLQAFDCLIEAVQVYQVNPRLWLRLAECCIMAHRQSNDEDRQMEKRLAVIQGCTGSGVHRKVILGPGVQSSSKLSSSDSAAMPMATLEFTSLCLRNALLLLPEDPLTATPPPTDDAQEAASKQQQLHDNMLVPAPPGNPMKNYEVANLRCSILASSAFVALCLNDYVSAANHAECLLKQPRLSGAHRYLGHLYQAEALVALDRIADAVGHLNPENVTDVSTLPPDVSTIAPEHKNESDKSDKNGEKDPQESTEAKGALFSWSPRDVPRARAIMQYNLATAHAIRGEYEKAMLNLTKSTQAIGLPLPAQMYFLRLYLDLAEGRQKVAQDIIKEHFSHINNNKIA